MVQHLPSTRPAIPFFLSTLLLFYSCPISGNRVQNTTENEWQEPEQLEESDSRMMRLTDGDVTKENQYPYMVAIEAYDPNIEEYSSRIDCGGSLISPTHVLTAAHCVCIDNSTEAFEIDQLVILLGAHFINETNHNAESVKNVSRIKIHEEYDPDNSYNNDIAILTLASPVEFTKKISPVCLPRQGSNYQYVGQMAIVTGWGHTEEDGNASQVLLHASLAIISNWKCQKIYADADAEITRRMMCAYQPGKDTCQGDSGGPMVIETEQRNRRKDCQWIQVGIVSWGVGCGRKGIPGVYTRVTSFLPWIKKEMSPNKSKFNFNKNQGVSNSGTTICFYF